MNKKDLLSDREETIALYEIYKPLLSSESVRRFEEYYYDDLSLSEICELESVSRSAIHDALSKTIKKLLFYEDKLEILKKRKKLAESLSNYKNSEDKEKEANLKRLLEDLENAI